jgi:hypothetical protein
MNAAAPSLAQHRSERTSAEDTILVAAAKRLAQQDAFELARALLSCRLHVYPWRGKRQRYQLGVAQLQITLLVPEPLWELFSDRDEHEDHLLRGEIANALRPLFFVRSLEIVPAALSAAA